MRQRVNDQSKNKTLNFLRYLGPGLLVTVGFILRQAPDSDMSYCGW